MHIKKSVIMTLPTDDFMCTFIVCGKLLCFQIKKCLFTCLLIGVFFLEKLVPLLLISHEILFRYSFHVVWPTDPHLMSVECNIQKFFDISVYLSLQTEQYQRNLKMGEGFKGPQNQFFAFIAVIIFSKKYFI